MPLPTLTCSKRLRRTPFSRRLEAAGVASFTVYNHMLLATGFGDAEQEYRHLKTAVQVWDVAAERQVELRGSDARKLVQLTTPRDLVRMADDQCYYIPLVDDAGRLLNEPVLIKLADDRYWVSLADSDMLYYYKGLAIGLGLDVEVFEPDVSPLAIQGPKSNELVRRVFGQEIVDTKFFRHKRIDVNGRQMVIARSGWSLQGGFEIYLDGSEHGEVLWDQLFEAGKGLDVRAGNPNGIERIEGGLLSYGSDVTIEHTPFEAGLGKFCDLQSATSCVGHAALLKQQEPTRQIRPLQIDGDAMPPVLELWDLEDLTGKPAGKLSSAAWSPDFETNVAIAMVDRAHWQPGTKLIVQTTSGPREAVVQEKFWLR